MTYPEPHVAVPDPAQDDYCFTCPLPVAHRVHLAPDAQEERILASVDAPAAPVGFNHPATAQAAAAKALPRSGTKKAAIFAIIANRPHGATDDELEQIMAKTHQSVSAARNALMNDGLICPLLDADGQQVTRRTRSGNDAIAWGPTTAALQRMGATG